MSALLAATWGEFLTDLWNTEVWSLDSFVVGLITLGFAFFFVRLVS